MKKINNKGFILAETLVVAVFLMVIFGMIYSNFYPIIGEYEKRENYDDVDGKYATYWIKRMIESSAYGFKADDYIGLNQSGYTRFSCQRFPENSPERDTCISLVKELEISRCNSNGEGCDIYITRYTLNFDDGAGNPPSFKKKVKEDASSEFLSPTKDYILSLPDYSIVHSSTKARFRVIVAFNHTRQTLHTEDGAVNEDSYYAFSTMEVIKNETE